MLETPPPLPKASDDPEGQAMQGRQLFAYYGLLFLFLLLIRSLLLELNAQFDLAIFPKLTAGVQMVIDNAAEFDNALNILSSLMYSFLFSLPIAIVYRITKEGGRFDPSLGQTIVLLSMVVTAVMVVISGDLARAFGLAGVVAAVRFRNTLDDAKDAVYVFLAIAIGMACGSRAFSTAVWTSLVMTTTLYLMWNYHFGQLPGRIVSSPEGGRKAKKQGKEKKEKKEKKKKKKAQARLDGIVEQQYRLIQLAAMAREPGEKKANSGLIIDSGDLARAQIHAESVLAAAGGKWRLANVTAREAGSGTLEFVGRIGKTDSSSELLKRLLAGDAPAFIKNAEFRPLKTPRSADPSEPLAEPGPTPAG